MTEGQEAAPLEHQQSQQQPKRLVLESGATLMAHGPHVLHEYMASTMETTLGRELPQMEVRFSNLSISADVVVADVDDRKNLPTLWNTVLKALAGCVAKRQVTHKEILKNVSGTFKPGTMTLILGQPSSGKSSLMKILSGRFPIEKNMTVEGEMMYNGYSQHEIRKRLPQFVTYVTQNDRHFPLLTPKETLEFAHVCCGRKLTKKGKELLLNGKGTSEQNQAALEAAQAIFAHYPEVIIEQLGLQDCQDTLVGDAMLRGVSGGERKRVTIGEMEFGMRNVTFMDEISTGLDSAATFDIISTQRSIAKTLRKTVVMALLQPSPEVFALFDNVLMLNAGEVMYFGPCDQVVEYFETLGFVCPPERDIADYLMDLGTHHQHRYEVAGVHRQPQLASEFAERFRESSIYHQTLRELETPLDSEKLENVHFYMDQVPIFHQSFWPSTLILLKRQIRLTVRNKPFLFGRTLMIIIMGLLYATTFYDFNPIEIQVVAGIIFAGVLFLSLGQASQLPAFLAARDVFYKQRGANFFQTTAFVLANAICQLPLGAGETLTFGTLVYFMCGFVARLSNFVIFELLLMLTNFALTAFVFFITAATPNIDIATATTMFCILLFIVFAGFIVIKSQIPDYLIWLYWISPVSWTMNALAINEYRTDEYDVCEYDGIPYCAMFENRTMGEYYLSLFDFRTDKVWIIYAIIFLVAMYVFFTVLTCIALEYKRYESPEHIALTKQADEQENEDEVEYALVVTPTASGILRNSTPLTPLPAKEFVVEVKSTEKNFTPVTLAFQDLWYSVPVPNNPRESIDLLKGISGYALPGTMTALMGASGAGKTTLMDVIAGRKTGGKIQGKIFMNGYEASDLAVRRATGYCEQMDIHSTTSTIREALTFSAFLRQDSSIPASKKYDSVKECIDLLDLGDIADQIIRGNSVEQMKRLTIGVELAAQPSILFLDEPTSGLDARSTKIIMEGVRKVAKSGRTIVCTIHQPSTEIFLLFDSLLLLKRGGETVFFGELGRKAGNLINYFESIPGVLPLPSHYNPAAWMLECIGAGVANTVEANHAHEIDFTQIYNTSEKKLALDTMLAKPGIGCPSNELDEVTFVKKRAASSITQLQFLTRRSFDMYWRSPTYNLTRLVMSLFLALIFGFTFTGADYATYQGLNSGVGMIFVATVFNGMISFQCAIPAASEDRAAFYRERNAQTYNALWYFVALTFVEIPYVFFSALMFTVVFYPLVGFTGFGTAVLYWINTALLILMQTYMGQMFAYALPSEEVAGIIGVLFNAIFFLFMGFSPPANLIPSGYKWLYELSPPRYALSILGALIFSDCPHEPTSDDITDQFLHVGPNLGCQPLQGAPVTVGNVTVKQYTESVFGMKHDEIWRNFAVVLAIIVLFRVLALLALRFINHQKR